MSRQTLFPGIVVTSIRATSGSSGRTLEFEEGLPENIDMERIQSFLSQLKLFESDLTDSTITYNLQVAAASEVAAKNKARAFVRAKNPFEITMIGPVEASKLPSMGVMGPGRDAYEVSATIRK